MSPCFECGNPSNHEHHVVPRVRGGIKTVPLCLQCHSLAHSRNKNMSHPILIKEGLDKARARGIVGGRRISLDYEKIEELRAQGLSLGQIVDKIGGTKGGISKALKRIKNEQRR